jgi:serine protease AprX
MGVKWRRRSHLLVLAPSLALGAFSVAGTTEVARADEASEIYLVTAAEGQLAAAHAAVAGAGGEVMAPLEVMDGFVASLPASSLDDLAAQPSIAGLTLDRVVTPEWGAMTVAPAAYDPWTQPGSMWNTTQAVGAQDAWAEGYTGAGIGVAVVDTGMDASHPALAGKIVAAVDFSGENNPARDVPGHGTYLGSIIAGNAPGDIWDAGAFHGVAPDAQLVNVKVANAAGATSSVRLMGGLNWIYQNRYDTALNIRVVNLSFGAPRLDDALADPLAVAVEKLWDAGIVVVVSAGNDGKGQPLLAPAYDDLVIAVGATDHMGTADPWDDRVAWFSNSSSVGRTVDVVAPGTGIIAAAATNSYPTTTAGNLGEGYVRGSGTSQAAAVTSGSIAVLLQQKYWFNPDRTKRVFELASRWLSYDEWYDQGNGAVYLEWARWQRPYGWGQRWKPKAHGSGQVVGDTYDDASATTSRWTTSRWTTSRWTTSRWLSIWE